MTVKVFLGERVADTHLKVTPIPPLTTSLDLDGIEFIELESADGRTLGRYRKEK